MTKSYLEAFISSILQYIKPSIYDVVFGFGYTSISVSMKNKEKYVDILQRKIIHTERENVHFIYQEN